MKCASNEIFEGKSSARILPLQEIPPDQTCICIFSGNVGAFVCLFFSFNMWNHFPGLYPTGVSARRDLALNPRNLLISYQTKRFNELLSHTGFDFCYRLMSGLKFLSAIPIFPPFILQGEIWLHNYICTYCNTNVLFQDDSRGKSTV